MSAHHYEVGSTVISSSDEEMVVDEPSTSTVPLKKRVSKSSLEGATVKRSRKMPRQVSTSDEEELATPLPPTPPQKKRSESKKKSAPADLKFSTEHSDDEELVVRQPRHGEPGRIASEAQKWQEVIETAKLFMTPLKVDTTALTMLFDQATYDCFKKACQAWLHEQGISLNLTYTTQKTFVAAMARFVFDFTMRHCNMVGKPNVNVTGASIWTHGCDSEIKCLHGSAMIQKEQTIEMDVTSENGQRALKEQPQKAKVTTNRWGRNIVQLRNSDALACVHDANSLPGNYNGKSCGMFYNDGTKALQAFRQIMSFQLAAYPKMPYAGTRLLMPLKCDCNYLNTGLPILGRQVCKVTPFVLTTPQGVDESSISDATVLASVRNPALLVFQCCNPVYRGSKGGNQKNCDFKISAPDFINALQMAKRFWSAYFPDAPAKVIIPEFKWSHQYQYQNSILPSSLESRDECLF